jgi:hypothetical protein
MTCPNFPTPAPDSQQRGIVMSVLTNYVERLERSIERNQAILENDIGEFEDLCNRGVELGDAAVLRQAEKFYKRALARFKEIEQVEQVLRGPKYRGLISRVPQRETLLLTIRGRYHQAYSRVERWRRNDPSQTQDEPEPRQDRGVPFESPHRVDALHDLLNENDRSPDGVPMAISYIVLQGDPRALREIPVDGTGIGERDVIERSADTEVRVALHHPAALSAEVIERVVRKRFFSVEGYRIRAVVYRLSVPGDLHSPFLSAIRLNLPRVGNREVLTLNPLEVGVGLAGNLA